MLSFSAASVDDLGFYGPRDGRLWIHRYAPEARHAHRHAEIEINLVRAGRAAYLLGDRRYDLARHSLVWLFPGQDHILLDESPDLTMWIGVFTPRLLARVCTTTETQTLREDDPPGRFCRRLADERCARLETLFAEVEQSTPEPARFNAGLGYALLSAWDAFRAAEEPAAGPDVHPAVERAARMLRDEADPLSVEQIGARVGLSASRLSRLFHQQTGVALVDFRNRQRLQRFLRMYGPGKGLSMLEAALDAGFGSYPQFHRVFRSQMGCGPAEYWRRPTGSESPTG